MKRRHLHSTIALGLSLAAVSTWAATTVSWSIPHSFSAGTPAKAAQVNANFTALENQILYLKQQQIAQQTTINNLQSQLSAVQGSAIMQLDPYVAVSDVPDTVTPSITYPTIQFVGANVQIVNGTSHSYTTNGLGNLIVGYNESTSSLDPFCSNGTYRLQSNCESHGYVWAQNQRSGSHNLVVGYGNAYTGAEGMVVGAWNIVNGFGASITGGTHNIASATSSVVSGGRENFTTGDYASVTGGHQNWAIGDFSSASGGYQNTPSGKYSSISGGTLGKAISEASSVGGGYGNWASGKNSSVSGGRGNTAEAENASVSGGFEIVAPNLDDWCGGGVYTSPNCH